MLCFGVCSNSYILKARYQMQLLSKIQQTTKPRNTNHVTLSNKKETIDRLCKSLVGNFFVLARYPVSFHYLSN